MGRNVGGLDRELFQRTFSKVKASPKMYQEVIRMTEQRKPKRFILRRLVVAALVLALAAALAMGANAATEGGLFKHFVSLITYCEDGSILLTYEGDEKMDGDIIFTVREFGKDGKGYITYEDKDGNTITEEVDISDQITIEKDGTVSTGEAGPDSAASQPSVGTESAQRTAADVG